MAHLGARRLRLPQLALAPECVDAAALRQHWAVLAAVLLEDGGPPLSAESLDAASAAAASGGRESLRAPLLGGAHGGSE